MKRQNSPEFSRKENLNKEINNLFESTQETIYNFENNMEKYDFALDNKKGFVL